mgnify:CR=1
ELIGEEADAPFESIDGKPIINIINEAIKTAFFLPIPHSSTIYAVGTSNNETVDVSAANDNNRKNVLPIKAP